MIQSTGCLSTKQTAGSPSACPTFVGKHHGPPPVPLCGKKKIEKTHISEVDGMGGLGQAMPYPREYETGSGSELVAMPKSGNSADRAVGIEQF